jgi:hypothetical protein
MYPVTSVKNSLQTIHAISCKTTIYRYVDLGTTDRGHMALRTRSCEKNGHNECGDGNIIGHYERELKYIFLFDLSIIID